MADFTSIFLLHKGVGMDIGNGASLKNIKVNTRGVENCICIRIFNSYQDASLRINTVRYRFNVIRQKLDRLVKELVNRIKDGLNTSFTFCHTADRLAVAINQLHICCNGMVVISRQLQIIKVEAFRIFDGRSSNQSPNISIRDFIFLISQDFKLNK